MWFRQQWWPSDALLPRVWGDSADAAVRGCRSADGSLVWSSVMPAA